MPDFAQELTAIIAALGSGDSHEFEAGLAQVLGGEARAYVLVEGDEYQGFLVFNHGVLHWPPDDKKAFPPPNWLAFTTAIRVFDGVGELHAWRDDDFQWRCRHRRRDEHRSHKLAKSYVLWGETVLPSRKHGDWSRIQENGVVMWIPPFTDHAPRPGRAYLHVECWIDQQPGTGLATVIDMLCTGISGNPVVEAIQGANTNV